MSAHQAAAVRRNGAGRDGKVCACGVSSTAFPRHVEADHGLALDLIRRLVPEGDCLVWTGARIPAGYGTLRRNLSTHRTAYRISFGEIPDRLWVCHRCDNPPCCNPVHLFLGTPKDNNDDMVRKGRANVKRGFDASAGRLTDEQVSEIRRRFVRGVRGRVSGNAAALATEFGITERYVRQLVNGGRRNWGAA